MAASFSFNVQIIKITSELLSEIIKTFSDNINAA